MNSQEPKFTNRLINETSPYLLQHAHNPVDWFPWGEEALDKASKENKLIIISIGYAACHWCHVMGHECFEDEEVAALMNDNFVSVKVDREERPDIDQVYMNAVQLITGAGGWPLNCIALPDGRPVYGGTYFPKTEWTGMLAQVLKFVKENPDKAEQQAVALTQGIRSGETIHLNAISGEFAIEDLKSIFRSWRSSIDFVNGGQRGAPKFPLPSAYAFLLHYHYLTGDTDALKAVTTTLDKMAEGGIYDQAGGGFSRYSTDELWKVPHFEKMLYDNAQLVSLYSAAYQKTQNPGYKAVVSETLDFIKREMTSREGGFYSSLDADSEGEEGRFYTWTYDEMQKILGDKAGLIIDYYNVSEAGNWEKGRNILFKRRSNTEAAERYNISESELAALVSGAKRDLLYERDKRIRPATDDKILASWNALMLKAYADAYRVFDNREYLDAALKNAEFLNTKLKSPDDRLDRNYKNGRASVNAFLDDYAFTIEAFISLYRATFDENWLNVARELSDYTLSRFYNEDNGMFYYTSDIDPGLISRNTEVTDNVIPSSNSVMAKNLYVLGQYFYNDDYIEKSKTMLNNVKQSLFRYGSYFANWDILMAWFAGGHYDLTIAGRDCEGTRREIDRYYLPDVFLSGGKSEGTLPSLENKFIEGKTMIYLCRDRVCKSPANDIRDVLKEILK